jgi:NTE family protein
MHSTAEARQLYNGVHSMLAWLYTRPSMFRHRFPGPWSVLPWMPNDVALYDHSPLIPMAPPGDSRGIPRFGLS